MRFLKLLIVCILLTGCSGDKDKKRLDGKRLSILQLQEKLQADASLRGQSLVLPSAISNTAWPMGGGYADHSMQHLKLAADIERQWSSSIGKGDTVLPQPVVQQNTVATIDPRGTVKLFDINNGKRIAAIELASEAPGNSIVHAGSRLYALTGDGRLIALSFENNKLAAIWEKPLPALPRGGITLANGRLFFRTSDGSIYAYNAVDGRFLWKQEDAPAAAALAQSANIAVSGDLVIAPQSNGDLEAYLASDGRSIWATTLGGRKSLGLGIAASLVGISGHPVIDRGIVYAAAQNGRFLAIDGRSGRRLWQLPIGSYNTPWVAGDNIFVLSDQHDLTALTFDGRIRWIRSLPKYKDQEKRREALVWYGPVLAGDYLWLAGGNRELLGFSIKDGREAKRLRLPDRPATAPIVADGKLLVITTDGDLVSYQ